MCPSLLNLATVSWPSTPQALQDSTPDLSPHSLAIPTNLEKEGWVKNSLGIPFGPSQIKVQKRNLQRQCDIEEKP